MSSARRPQKLIKNSEHTFESIFNTLFTILIILRILLDAISAKFAAVDLLTAFIVIGLAFQEIAKQRKPVNLSAKKTFTLFYFFLLISSIHAFKQENVSFPMIVFQLKFLLLILVFRFAFRMSLRERIKIRNALIFCLTISAAIGLIESLFGRNILTQNFQTIRLDRFGGLILWPNIASILYGITLCGVIVSSRRASIKVLFSLILLGGIIATGTVTGTAATILGLFWIFRKKYLIFLSLLFIGFLFSNYVGYKIGLLQKISLIRIPNFELIQYQRSTDSATWRLIQWQRVLSVAKDNIFFGIGLGSAENSRMIGGYLPHSDYLRIIFETGIIGFIVVLTAAKSGIKKLFPKEMQVKSPLTLACLTIVAISSLSENLLGQTSVYLILPFFVINTEEGS
jgi:O-antigen ligase